MHSSSRLDPKNYLNKINSSIITNSLTEVEIRRIASSCFWAIFNFWMEKNNKTQGDPGDLVNYIRIQNIPSDIKMKIEKLRLYRTAADHYSSNPACVTFKGKSRPMIVEFNPKTASESLQFSLDVYNYI